MNLIRIRNAYRILWDNSFENGYFDIHKGDSNIWLPWFLKCSDGQDPLPLFFWYMTSLHKYFSALRRNIGSRRLLGLCRWRLSPFETSGSLEQWCGFMTLKHAVLSYNVKTSSLAGCSDWRLMEQIHCRIHCWASISGCATSVVTRWGRGFYSGNLYLFSTMLNFLF
jgi:hypothetical protein